jgi:MIP family channel proteins
MDKNMRATIAEFFGTFTLVFLGAGAGALAGTNGIGQAGVAFTHGIALMISIYTWGWVSGAHVNPAVTLGALITGKVNIGKALGYWIAQFAGAAVAAYLLDYIVPGTNLGQTLGKLNEANDSIRVIVVEAVLTFFLVASVFSNGIASKNGNVVGIAIGLVLTADILMGGSLTGASMNPARTFGPALVKQDFSYLHLYIIGPAIGAVLAALIYNIVFLYNDDVKKA